MGLGTWSQEREQVNEVHFWLVICMYVVLLRWLSGKESACNEEMRVRSLGQENPLEKGMATHSSILAWRIPQRNLTGYSPWGRKIVGHNLVTQQQQQHVHRIYGHRLDTPGKLGLVVWIAHRTLRLTTLFELPCYI